MVFQHFVRLRSSARCLRPSVRYAIVRAAATSAQAQKKEGDISDAFASLSGLEIGPLDARFATLKSEMIAGNDEAIRDSWYRLLVSLRTEIDQITTLGPQAIPSIDFRNLHQANAAFSADFKKRGIAVIRNVVPSTEALKWKQSLRDYIAANPHTKAFPPENPQVYELYWSPAQIAARAHPNLLKTQRFLMQHWHSQDPAALVSPSHPVSYADRLRMRLPGDNRFALGPHIDGGSCERWEPQGYGHGKVYEAIFQGRWEEYDPWEASSRLPVMSDLYQGVGACSMFRMFQGWLSMSTTGPHEGTLLVNPLLKHTTAYLLLRPFFAPKELHGTNGISEEAYLDCSNWDLEPEHTSWLQGATPGRGQEMHPTLHPHLRLPQSMVHVPVVQPGDYVVWHCDSIHAVDSVHAGATDSSVLYIPSCPLTVSNAYFVARQREAFLGGWPCPDFGGGSGESKYIGRPGVSDVGMAGAEEGMQAMGLTAWDSEAEGLTAGQREVMDRTNKILGFYD